MRDWTYVGGRCSWWTSFPVIGADLHSANSNLVSCVDISGFGSLGRSGTCTFCRHAKQKAVVGIPLSAHHAAPLLSGSNVHIWFMQVPPDENAAKAVDARQEIDLRIGAAFTRYQTLLLQVLSVL